MLIEISLLEPGHNAYSKDGAERLEAVAKRYRVNVQKIRESVASEFASRRNKRLERVKAKAARTPSTFQIPATPAPRS